MFGWTAAGLAVLSAGFVFVAAHPFLTYPLSLITIRAMQRNKLGRSEAAGDGPRPSSVTFVCCAFNEEAVIREKVENLLALRDTFPELNVEILIYDDKSADRTPAILAEFEDRIVVVQGTERGGKSVGMNALVEQATGEIVIFSDANVSLSEQLVRSFRDAFADPRIGATLGHLVYGQASTDVAAAGASYWRFEERLKQWETETGSAIGADGSAFGIRRDLFVSAPSDVDDDFHTSMSILCAGHRVVRCGDAIAHEPTTERSSEEVFRKIRIACRAINCHRRLRRARRNLSRLDQYKYLSHKWIRWHTGYWLLSAVISATAAIYFRYGIQIGLLATGLIGAACLVMTIAFYIRVPLLSSASQALAAIVATAIGVAQSWRGATYRTWTPPASTRVTTQP